LRCVLRKQLQQKGKTTNLETGLMLKASDDEGFKGEELIGRAVAFCSERERAEVYVVDADNSAQTLIALEQSTNAASLFTIAVVRAHVENASIAAVVASAPARFGVFRVDLAVSGAVDAALTVISTLLAQRLPPHAQLTLVSNDRFVQMVAAMLPPRRHVRAMRAAEVWCEHAPHLIVAPRDPPPQPSTPTGTERAAALSVLTNEELVTLFDRYMRRLEVSHAAWCAQVGVSESKLDRFRALVPNPSRKVRTLMINWLADAPTLKPTPVGTKTPAKKEAACTPATTPTSDQRECMQYEPEVRELIEFYHRTWGASHNSFCDRYGVDKSNFSKFRRGLKPSPFCAKALARWKADFEALQQQTQEADPLATPLRAIHRPGNS